MIESPSPPNLTSPRLTTPELAMPSPTAPNHVSTVYQKGYENESTF